MNLELKNKIEELFEYRGFHDLYEYSGLGKEEINQFHNKLVNLQSKIYYLDAYLESCWDVTDEGLDYYWVDIKKILTDFGIPLEVQRPYILQILKYQKHEVELRKNRLPTSIDMEYFYFYKSCDVKLMRRLIHEQLPNVKRLYQLSDWRFFDLVTEVNDDTTDLEEDQHTINGNRLLISLNTHGSDYTFETFNLFLSYISKKSTERFRDSKDYYSKRINELTQEQVIITKNLLLDKIGKYPKGIEAVLFDHLAKMNIK
jgi:hypothetical protein